MYISVSCPEEGTSPWLVHVLAVWTSQPHSAEMFRIRAIRQHPPSLLPARRRWPNPNAKGFYVLALHRKLNSRGLFNDRFNTITPLWVCPSVMVKSPSLSQRNHLLSTHGTTYPINHHTFSVYWYIPPQIRYKRVATRPLSSVRLVARGTSSHPNAP
jgi:hypothetical protein